VIAVLVLAAFLAVVGGLVAVAYNGLVRARNRVRDAWADVDAELQRRYDLVPGLAAVARGYAAHEHRVLEDVIRARAGGRDAAHRAAPEEAVVTGIRHLVGVVEAHPDLLAGHRFLDLQRQLVATEDRIAVTRRIHNARVREYNTRLESFPVNVIGRVARFRRAASFDVEESVRQHVPSAV
jgi:LemA protein